MEAIDFVIMNKLSLWLFCNQQISSVLKGILAFHYVHLKYSQGYQFSSSLSYKFNTFPRKKHCYSQHYKQGL